MSQRSPGKMENNVRQPRYRIRFPSDKLRHGEQDKSWFLLVEDGQERCINFHDYAELYRRPGLYEQLFYQRLKCTSPTRIGELLRKMVINAGGDPARLRVLDVGAGNGMVGEVLMQHGVARIVGIDLIEEARQATARDRPGVYDGYYVADLTRLAPEMRAELLDWDFDAMTTVAALGFGDIPVAVFAAAYNLIADGGWIAFNIRDSFLDKSDCTGFSRLVQRFLQGQYFELHLLERYGHRLSIEGGMLHYYAVVGRKRGNIDAAWFAGQ